MLSFFDTLYSFPLYFFEPYDFLTDDSLVIEVPGYSSNDISVKIKGKQLLVSGKVKNAPKSFRHTYTYRQELDPSKISAKCENGLLTINVDFNNIEEEAVDIEIK